MDLPELTELLDHMIPMMTPGAGRVAFIRVIEAIYAELSTEDATRVIKCVTSLLRADGEIDSL